MKTNILKLLFLAAPIVLGFACSSDDDDNENKGIAAKPVALEYDGVVNSICTEIKVPATGGEYELRCVNNLRPQVSYFLINEKDSVIEGSLSYLPFSEGTIKRGIDNISTATVYPALVSNADTTFIKWIAVEENCKEGIYKVSIAENDGNPRFVTISLGDDLMAGYINLTQASK